MKLIFSSRAVRAALLVGAAAVLAGCGNGAKSAQGAFLADSASGGIQTANAANAKMAVRAPMPEPEFPTAAGAEALAESASDGGAAAYERKLIRHGSVQLEVASLAETHAQAEQWVRDLGGWISYSSEDARALSLTARIPSSRFDEAMGRAEGMGRLRSKDVSSQDVTERYYDLETRLATKRVMLERLETYLRNARDIKDMIEIETKINAVTGDLESMQGRMNYLSQQVDFSEITVYASLPVNRTEQGFVLPDTRAAARRFVGNVVNFAVSFVFAVLYVVIYGVPIVLALFLAYWLCWGRIGLLRRLFAKIRAKPGR